MKQKSGSVIIASVRGWGFVGLAALCLLVQVPVPVEAQPAAPSEEADGASEELLQGLKSESSGTRLSTVRSLGEDKTLAKANLPAIVAAVEDENGAVSVEAMRVLAALGADGKAGVPVLIRLLGSADSFIVLHAVETLGDMGAVAKDAVPALTELLNKAKVALDPQSAGIIARAAQTLGFGPGGTSLNLAAPAAIAIDRIDPGNNAAQPVMSLTLSDRKGETEYRVDVAEHILKSGQSSPEAMRALVDALGDSNEYVRRRSAMILAGLGRAEGVPVLAQTLTFDNEVVPLEAASALAKLGPAAHAALPALREVATGQTALSEAARKAIAQIEAR